VAVKTDRRSSPQAARSGLDGREHGVMLHRARSFNTSCRGHGDTHCGWENNDGAYGDFIFDVAKRTITLDFNERYTASDYSQNVF
jgi:hypothetical protein